MLAGCCSRRWLLPLSSVALIDLWVCLQPRCVWLCPDPAEESEDEDPPEPEHGAPVRGNVTVSELTYRFIWPGSVDLVAARLAYMLPA